jgi:hypothetical protein
VTPVRYGTIDLFRDYASDIPEADIRFFETGRFALETRAEPIPEFLTG